MPAEQVNRFQVGVHDPVPIHLCQVFEGIYGKRPRRIDQDVDRAERLLHLRHQAHDRLAARHIRHEHIGPSTVFPDLTSQCAGLLLVGDIIDRHGRSCLGKFPDNNRWQVTGRPSHQGHPPR